MTLRIDAIERTKLTAIGHHEFSGDTKQRQPDSFQELWKVEQDKSVSARLPQDQGIIGALRTVDEAMQQYEATAALSRLVPKSDLIGVHQMNMKLEHDSHVAKMMFTVATSVAGSVKSTLTQLLKNQ